MNCPVCGTAMNHHADKLEHTESGAVSRDLGGVVKEVHTCPRWGNVETRVADEGIGPERSSVLS
jgi:hypothetical protein